MNKAIHWVLYILASFNSLDYNEMASVVTGNLNVLDSAIVGVLDAAGNAACNPGGSAMP